LLGVPTEFEILKGYGLALCPAADALVAEGTLAPDRADFLLSYLDEADAAGQFCGVVVMHIVAGRVPE
jgi:hypothetical protein